MAKGWKMNLEQRKRLSDSHKGKQQSEETRRKRSESMKGKMPKNIELLISRARRFKKGQPAWNKGLKGFGKGHPGYYTKKGKEHHRFGTHPSEETLIKQSKSHLGIKYPTRRYSPEQGFQKGHKINLGRHFPPEFGRKIVEIRRRNDSYKFSEESKRKLSDSQKKRYDNLEVRKKLGEAIKKGMANPEVRKKLSESVRLYFSNPEARKRQSEATKGRHLSPKSEFKKGHKLSEESLRKRREAITGEKCYLWKGGISFEPYSLDWTNALKKFIRKRDNHTCQICFKVGNQVHHIDYNKKNCNPENLITLCRSCHVKTNQHREKWKKFFEEVLNRERKV